MNKIKTEELLQRQSQISDRELIELCETKISELYSFKNNSSEVAPQINNIDMLISELIRRYKNTI